MQSNEERLNNELLWKAVESCDSRYDGQLFYAVKTTKIFCRPSCKSKTPIRENVTFYPLYHMALKEGYRPCKRCRPDMLGSPNDKEIVAAAKSFIEQDFTSSLTLDQLSKEVGMNWGNWKAYATFYLWRVLME